ncbi:glycosyltransferase [bacterium]|nr:glycosyltransferase [bacterium]
MSLSILIVNWKSKDFLRQCLLSIQTACPDLDPELVVVDGGSFDGCDELLAREFPAVKFVQSPANIGFGRSNNLGFQQVTSEALLLLNPDTELRPGAVQRLLAELAARPDAGIIGPRLLNTDGSLQTSCVRALPTPLNRALDSELFRRLLPESRLWGVARAFRASDPVPVEAVSGACMLLRTETFRRVGGFSPEFFMYGEDMDLCAKVRRLGLTNVYVPDAVVVHHGSGSSNTQVSQFATVMMRVAGDTYMRLNHGPATALLYRLLQAVSALVRLCLLLPASLLLAGERRVAARVAVQKWWYVLRWSAGFSPIQPPSLPSVAGSELASPAVPAQKSGSPA